MKIDNRFVTGVFAAATNAVAVPGSAQAADEEELAKKLNNPVASLISVPFQFNWDHDFSANREGRKFYLNIPPVIPAKLNDDWTLISGVIVPIVDQHIPVLSRSHSWRAML